MLSSDLDQYKILRGKLQFIHNIIDQRISLDNNISHPLTLPSITKPKKDGLQIKFEEEVKEEG